MSRYQITVRQTNPGEIGGSINLRLGLTIEFSDAPEAISDAFDRLLAVLKESMSPAELRKFLAELERKISEAQAQRARLKKGTKKGAAS